MRDSPYFVKFQSQAEEWDKKLSVLLFITQNASIKWFLSSRFTHKPINIIS